MLRIDHDILAVTGTFPVAHRSKWWRLWHDYSPCECCHLHL